MCMDYDAAVGSNIVVPAYCYLLGSELGRGSPETNGGGGAGGSLVQWGMRGEGVASFFLFFSNVLMTVIVGWCSVG